MVKLPVGWFHSRECAFQYSKAKGQAAIKRKQAKERREKDAEFKAMKARVKEDQLGHQHKLTQKVFNRMRVLQELLWFREQGREPECISCGHPLGGDQWCCGHFKTVGAHPELRYDERNTYLQHNHNCNMHLSGDINGTKNTMGYMAGLEYRFGTEEAKAIIAYCESPHDPIKWTGAALKKFRSECAAKVRELEQQLNSNLGAA